MEHEKQVKRSLETGRRRKEDSKWFKWSVLVDDFCTSTCKKIPVCTSMYYNFLNCALFACHLRVWENHMSLPWLKYVPVLIRKFVPVLVRTYHYLIIMCTGMYWSEFLVLTCTGTYQYVVVYTSTYYFSWWVLSESRCTGFQMQYVTVLVRTIIMCTGMYWFGTTEVNFVNFLVRTSTRTYHYHVDWYVLKWFSCTDIHWYVPVRTSIYEYVLFFLMSPVRVQVYRIPDAYIRVLVSSWYGFHTGCQVSRC